MTKFWLVFILWNVVQVLLWPLKVVYGIITRLVWKPSLKPWPKEEEKHNIDETFSYLKDKFDVSAYFISGGGAQFSGYASIINDESWEEIKIYWLKDRFHRNAYDPDKKRTFSSDQFVGMLFAIWYRHKTKGLTQEEVDRLRPIFEGFWFKNRIGGWIPMREDDTGRGKTLKWLSLGPEMIQIKAATKACRSIFGGWTYTIMDWCVNIQLWPSFICADHGFWIGNTYLTALYSSHTKAHFAWIAGLKKPLENLAERHPWNYEIQALAYSLTGKEIYKQRVINELEYYPKDMKERGGYSIPRDMENEREMFRPLWNIWKVFRDGWKPQEQLPYILPVKYRYHKHIGEKAPNDDQTTNNPRTGWTGDFLVPYILITRDKDKWK